MRLKKTIISELQLIADKKKSENFKYSAYKKGIKSIKALPSKIVKSITKKDLLELPNIGKSIGSDILKIRENYNKKFNKSYPLHTLIKPLYVLCNNLNDLQFVKNVILTGAIRRLSSSLKKSSIIVVLYDIKDKAKLKNFLDKSKMSFLKSTKNGFKYAISISDRSFVLNLDVTTDEYLGNFINLTTGTKAYNKALKRLAKSKGLKVTKKSTIRIKTGKHLKTKSEKSLFKHLKIPYILPECRITGKELGLDLSKLVVKNNIKGDLHIHSSEFSKDSDLELGHIVIAAKAKGYSYVGIADHTKPNPSSKITSLQNYSNKIKKYSCKTLRVYAGVELDLNKLGNNKYYKFKDINKYLDYIILACHINPNKNLENRFIKAIKKITIPIIIAHPTNRIIGKRKPYDMDWNKLISMIKKSKKQVYLEINSDLMRLDLDSKSIRNLQGKIKFVINSDAHNIITINNLTEIGVIQARKGLLTSKDILNTKKLIF